MNREETLELYKKGKDAWNAWAQGLLDERKELEASGEWEAKKEGWRKRAKADFSTQSHPYTFNGILNFSYYIFPSVALFDHATFQGEVQFIGAIFRDEAWFTSSKFEHYAWFTKAKFQGLAGFCGTIFKGTMAFASAAFEDKAWFDKATFEGEVGFLSATFNVEAKFDCSEFHNKTEFSSAKFQGDVSFYSAAFLGTARFSSSAFLDDARFTSTIFHKMTRFDSARFAKVVYFLQCLFMHEASFEAIQTNGSFSLSKTKFQCLPNFIQAHFIEPPRLDDVDIKLYVEEKFDAPARWRALKRMAASGHDYQNEISFAANEFDAELETGLWQKSKLRYFAVWIYGFISDYGRSVIRPIGIWFALIVFFYLPYLSIAMKLKSPMQNHTLACVQSLNSPSNNADLHGTNKDRQAMILSLKTALIFVDAGQDTSNATLRCLYGRGEDGRPLMPYQLGIGTMLQKLLSVPLIFLFGLGVRNLLRMK